MECQPFAHSAQTSTSGHTSTPHQHPCVEGDPPMSQPYGPPPQPEPGHGRTHPPRSYVPRRARKKRGCLIWAAAVVAVPVLLVGGCLAIATRGSDDTPSTATGPKTSREARAAGIGDVVEDGKFSFKVTKLDTASKVGDDVLGKSAQGEFVLVNVTVKNIGDEAQSFAGDAQKLLDASGKEYSADSEAALYLGESKSLYEQVNPGNSVRGVVLFDVPKGTEPVAIELHDSVFSGGVKVSLK
ncbi:DUF4352 domain-containing protein [Microtetraspora glauca]|uniref:DUF4352 domain-containing protein n=1 Tax=Microtetraspora glauca TaxID=1996 RepID=UPI003F4CCEFE